MKIYICSDNHVYGALPEHVIAFHEEAEKHADEFFDCGDSWEAVRYGWKAVLEDPASLELARIKNRLARNVACCQIEGNHDYGIKASKILDEWTTILSHCWFSADGYDYLVVHGWREYDLSLSWLKRLYGYVFRYLPQFASWYDKFFSTPGALKGISNPNEEYWAYVLHMDYLAMRDTIKRDVRIIYGHTHNQQIWRCEHWMTINAGTALEPNNYGIIIDNGAPRYWNRTIEKDTVVE